MRSIWYYINIKGNSLTKFLISWDYWGISAVPFCFQNKKNVQIKVLINKDLGFITTPKQEYFILIFN